jgi:hypothetical protein
MRYLILSVLAAAGCYGTSGVATVGYTSDGYYDGYYSPDLVYVSPGVQVIANYNEPIFYSGGAYWRYYDNRWYRSPYYNRGWVYATPPYAVRNIHSPYSYRYYRPHGYVSRGDYYNRPYYRDHRTYNRGYYDNRPDPRRYDRSYQRDHRYYNQRTYQSPQRGYHSPQRTYQAPQHQHRAPAQTPRNYGPGQRPPHRH